MSASVGLWVLSLFERTIRGVFLNTLFSSPSPLVAAHPNRLLLHLKVKQEFELEIMPIHSVLFITLDLEDSKNATGSTRTFTTVTDFLSQNCQKDKIDLKSLWLLNNRVQMSSAQLYSATDFSREQRISKIILAA
jgi:hypothetical protein